MLVAVLMIFTIFSFTGVAVLNVSYLSSSASMETINNIKLQYAVESSINEALWRINVGADSLVNTDADGITTVWNEATNVLSVNVDKFQMESEILLDLSEDTHFDRGIAAEEEITLDGFDAGLDDEHQVRGNFNFLPEADLEFFMENPDYTHGGNGIHWHDDNLPDGKHIFTGSYLHMKDTELDSGIIIFTGNYIEIEDINISAGTLVFTGHHITFKDNNQVFAPTGDSTNVMPALVFTHPDQNFQLYSPYGNETIVGAIYSKKDITLYNGHVSGPVVGRNVRMFNHFQFMDSNHSDKFGWTKGFGHRGNYDWPKQIGRWKIHKWIKKQMAA